MFITVAVFVSVVLEDEVEPAGVSAPLVGDPLSSAVVHNHKHYYRDCNVQLNAGDGSTMVVDKHDHKVALLS